MAEIEISVEEGVTTRTFKREAALGRVQFYRVRGNGTRRHIPILPQGTSRRQQAVEARRLRESGMTVAETAEALGVSLATLRRLEQSLLLTEEVERYTRRDVQEIMESVE